MYCQKCGADNLENAAMCQSCGGVFVYSQPSKTSGMAITSMILGISGFSMLGVFGVTWLIGLVLGIVALSRIGKSGGMLRGKGFAITGIATSAVGLAIVLTIIGVGLFVSSVKTISLSRTLKMYDKIMTSAETDQKPAVKGWVCILSNKAEPGDKCTKALFVPEQFKAADLAVISDIMCEQGDNEPIKVSWAFAGTENGADSYVFKLTIPIDEKTTKAFTKIIIYDGKEQVIFEDARRKIFVNPQE